MTAGVAINGRSAHGCDRLPADSVAERDIAIAVLNYPTCAAAGEKLLDEKYFVDQQCGAIVGAAMHVQREYGCVDAKAVATALAGHSAFPDGASDLVHSLEQEYATQHLFPKQCAAVVEGYRKRRNAAGFESLTQDARNGSKADDNLRDALQRMREWQDEDRKFGRRDRMSLAELADLNPRLLPPVIDGWLRQCETANIVSVSKIGKSWLLYYLLISQVTRTPLFGRFATTGGRALLIDNELHASTLAHRIPIVGDAMGIPRDEYQQSIDVMALRGRLRSLTELSVDLELIEPGKYSLIAMDAKYRFAQPGASENDNASEAMFYNEIDRLAERTRAAIVLIHHSSKGSQSDKRVTDVGAGAGSQSRAADAHLVLREHEEEGVCVLDAALRSFAPIEPVALRWKFPLWIPDSSADPARLKRQPHGNEQRQADRDREAADLIFKAIREDGPATARQLRSRTGLSRERQQRVLDLLTAEGHLTTSETIVKGNTCDVYQITQ